MSPWQEKLEQVVSTAADEAFRLLMQSEFFPVYLYFTPSKGSEWGKLLPVAETCGTSWPPAGAELAWNERLPRNLTRDQIRARIREIAGRLPILPTERK